MFLCRLKRLNHLNRFIQLQTTSHISSNAKKEDDLFGISDVTNYDVMGTKERENVEEDKFNKKYAYMTGIKRLDREEAILEYSYGKLRLDRDNQAKYHGQFEEDNEKMRFDAEALQELDEQIDDNDPELATKELSRRKLEENEINQLMQSISSVRERQFNKTDEQQDSENNKFQPNSDQFEPRRRPKIDTSNVDIYDMSPVRRDCSNQKLVYNVNFMYQSYDFNYEKQWHKWIERDIQCFKSPLAKLFREQQSMIHPVLTDMYVDMKSDRMKRSPDQAIEVEDESNLYTPLKSLNEIEQEINEEEEIEEPTHEMNIKEIFQSEPEKIEEDIKVTSLDYMRMIKRKEVKIEANLKRVIDKKSEKAIKLDTLTFEREKMSYDSKGFKNFRNQTFNMYALSEIDRALYLESETFFNHHGLVAINKPYGLVCPGDNEMPGMDVSDRKKKPVKLLSFLDHYARLIAAQDKNDQKENSFEDLSNPKLYPIHKLDRNCTGVYIMAKNKESAVRVHDLIKKQQIKQFYVTITKAAPSVEKASIDIPIELNRKDERKRMVLRPVLDKEYQVLMRPSKYAEKAVTNYRILKSHKSAAYLELSPLTSIRHQMRVHLGFGLRTPILGDHLYDNAEFVSYQKLSMDILLSLNVRPTKTFQIPLHLHCKQIILYQFGKNDRDISLKAELPNFFLENLKSLKLN